ncbi:hypothetical protein [Yersinia enterocolitica]|uniref:hypothetical protein n=1 Tax=Yersinia enterocolitica TaxID=630 RepID=UPI0003820D86|nr:hypothetical protein [Yersinia enterocolitica]
MSESITSIKLSIFDYIPPAILYSPNSEQIHTKLQRYMKDGWKVKDETTYIGGEIVRSVVTKNKLSIVLKQSELKHLILLLIKLTELLKHLTLITM